MTGQQRGGRLTGAEIEALRQASGRSRVLVAGSLNHDEILIADHDPGDEGAVLVRERVTAPGGHAGNCASALAALGAGVSLLAAVGADDTGESLISDLRGRGVDVACIARISGSPTGRVIIPVLGEQHFMLLLPGANDQLSAEHVQQALSTDYDALVLFDPAPAALAEIFSATAGSAVADNVFWNPGGVYAHQQSARRYCRSAGPSSSTATNGRRSRQACHRAGPTGPRSCRPSERTARSGAVPTRWRTRPVRWCRCWIRPGPVTPSPPATS